MMGRERSIMPRDDSAAVLTFYSMRPRWAFSSVVERLARLPAGRFTPAHARLAQW